MQTAKIIYTAIAVLTILPLIAFNVKNMRIKIEGEKPRPNIRNIVLVSLAAIIMGLFIFNLYRFTINYQPQLVLERFMTSYSSVISGRIDQDKFFKEATDICSPELLGQKAEFLEMIENDYKVLDSMVEGNSVRFQLGEIIYPKYYLDNEIFEQIEGVKQIDRQPIYMLSMIEVDEARKYYISLLDLDAEGNKWMIVDINEASQEIVDYASKNYFMKAEHANKWFIIKQ